MLELRLYMAQRITALIMAPLVIGHIAVMIYAVQGGLSAGEILGAPREACHGRCSMAALSWLSRSMAPLACAPSCRSGQDFAAAC